MSEDEARADARQYEISPSQAAGLMSLAAMLKAGDLSFRSDEPEFEKSATELVADVTQELALQVRQ